MKRSASRVLSALLSLMVFSSGCSIKEERDVCPCRLFLDLKSLDKLDQTPFLLGVMSDDGFEYTTVIDCDDFQDTYILDVPRTDLDIVVWSGGGDCMHQQGLTIPLGSGCPPVYIYSRRLAAYGEAVYDTVFLNKNYCILNVSVENPDDIRGMMIRGEVAGYDRIGNPDHGDFRIDFRKDSSTEESYSFYLPRQDDARLYLDVVEADGMVKTFPLHDYISAFGYDWKAQDLSDLNMHLNFTPAGVVVSVKVWDEEFVIDIVI
jgi:hypothetical protein